jgi:hypothetical protein
LKLDATAFTGHAFHVALRLDPSSTTTFVAAVGSAAIGRCR